MNEFEMKTGKLCFNFSFFAARNMVDHGTLLVMLNATIDFYLFILRLAWQMFFVSGDCTNVYVFLIPFSINKL